MGTTNTNEPSTRGEKEQAIPQTENTQEKTPATNPKNLPLLKDHGNNHKIDQDGETPCRVNHFGEKKIKN